VKRLLDDFARLPALELIRDRLFRRREVTAGGIWGSSRALLAALLARRHQGPVLLLVADDEEADRVTGDLRLFLPERTLQFLVTQDRDRDARPEPHSLRRRLRTLEQVRAEAGRFFVVVPLAALMDPVPSSQSLQAERMLLQRGGKHDPQAIVQRAVAAGMRAVPLVVAPGEVSLRRDILDVFPLSAERPVRLEFLDEELESIRFFDPDTQRSTGTCEVVELPLSAPTDGTALVDPIEHFWHKDLLVLRLEKARLDEQTERLEPKVTKEPGPLARAAARVEDLAVLSTSSLPSGDIDLRILAAGSGAAQAALDPMARVRALTHGPSARLLVVCRNDAERERFGAMLAEKGVAPSPQLVLLTGELERGFRVPDLATTVVSHAEFLGTGEVRRPVVREPVIPSRALQSFFELARGDIVVHAVHGVARFEGLERMTRGGGTEDHLKLRFKDDVLLLVPSSKVDLVQKYVGGGTASPPLDKMGGKGFARRKAEVEQALVDMAADLLDVQAIRARTPGFEYPPDDADVATFEKAFPFVPTRDQVTTIAEVKKDMESPKPMDRLLCGDVGFGKTEVAMRAAFKAALAGKQVAVLVPTTVLAEQHLTTFRARMADWPVRIDVLSRFHNRKEHTRVLKEVASGAVDILVGTHRILSQDVAFKDLGLLVVDEEQRFGVAHKEKLKALRASVDVLTLTATPIPRTLHMSLLGIRDISALTTPPDGRQDVETRLLWRDPLRIGEAIRAELRRGGQVFFLHNRVEDLDLVAGELRRLVPEARVITGHGQMEDRELEQAVRSFVQGEADLLCCTTIIESGLDIPRANTILIDRADMFGLADLHQLRGRVGRSAHRAYCYLLLDPAHPPNEDAKKRLKAVEELSSLGSGFQIAMKDLEIRGAGNILGPEQSGHITAVGYDMYCRLLRVATARVKSEPVIAPEEEVDLILAVEAFLPDEWLPNQELKLEVLRSMDGATAKETYAEIRSTLVDRFGAIPEPAENLLVLFLLKHLLLALSVRGVQLMPPDQLIVRHPPARPLSGDWLAFFPEVRPVEPGRTHLVLPAAVRTPAEVARFLKAALLGEEEAGRMARRPGRPGAAPQSRSRPPFRPR
jgi:transcription-repair coupling factor (superfamily II helicase)